MSWAFSVAIRGDLKKWCAANAAAVEAGTRRAVTQGAASLRTAVRRQVRSAGFKGRGATLAKSVRSRADRTASVPTAIVYSRAVVRGQGRAGPVDLLLAHDRGETIRSRGGKWLAIPTGQGPVGRRAGQYQSLSKMLADPRERGRVAVVPARGGKMVALWTPNPGSPAVVTHVLVREVRLRKRLDLARAERETSAKLPQLLARAIEREAQKKGIRDVG